MIMIMMRRLKIWLLPIIILYNTAFDVAAQGELDLQNRILYRNELSYGLFLNSNGLGADLSFGKRQNARNNRLYQMEILYLKHPKEYKMPNPYYPNKSFVFGKINSFLELRAQWGHQHEIYRKNDANGISVRYFYSLGPTIGFLKPIYYEVFTSVNLETLEYKTQKFNTSIHQYQIYSKASVFKGMNEISIIPGASAKFGFTFEFSKRNTKLNAIEVGAGFDIFTKEIPLMATEANQFTFLNLFAGYRFGKVMDVSNVAKVERQRNSWKENRASRKLLKEQRKAEKQKDDF